MFWGITFGTARVLLAAANLPPTFHPFAMQSAVWITNRLPRPSRGGKSAFQMLSHKVPDISYLYSFAVSVRLFSLHHGELAIDTLRTGASTVFTLAHPKRVLLTSFTYSVPVVSSPPPRSVSGRMSFQASRAVATCGSATCPLVRYPATLVTAVQSY
jgi:hypothetical protein